MEFDWCRGGKRYKKLNTTRSKIKESKVILILTKCDLFIRRMTWIDNRNVAPPRQLWNHRIAPFPLGVELQTQPNDKPLTITKPWKPPPQPQWDYGKTRFPLGPDLQTQPTRQCVTPENVFTDGEFPWQLSFRKSHIQLFLIVSTIISPLQRSENYFGFRNCITIIITY